jgi:hypothetical protein
MKILAIDGKPVPGLEEEKPASAAKTVEALKFSNEDFEWYPTTDEILLAMRNDLRCLFKKEIIGSWHDRGLFYTQGKKDETGCVKSFLDVGAGDGRVFAQFKGGKNLQVDDFYAIEKAQHFAEELIQGDVFLIGRDFFRTSLIDKHYSVIFSNPPYAQYMPWVVRLLQEANFGIMYLVIPVRWEQNQEIMLHAKRYDVETLGEYDFLDGDRPARARVNLIRLMKPRRKIEGRYYEPKEDGDDAFDRWIYEHLGKFENPDPETEKKIEHETNLKLKNGTIADLVENYEYEMNSLLEAFKALGKLPVRIVEDLGMNKDKIISQIKENISNLKDKHWRFAFGRLDAINRRLTRETSRKMLNRMNEFRSLDFNEDNIYSVVLWVIKNFNRYTGEQILEVFDALTSQGYIKAYKSNVHWSKDDWRYTKGEGKPDKYILDYRLVTHCYVPKWGDPDSIITDLMVICECLGYPIPSWEQPDYTQDGSLQEFHTRYMGRDRTYQEKKEIAFTARLYLNNNLHLKINEKIMLKFNIEVARLRHWINGPEDIEREYGVPQEEAIKLWREPGLIKIGQADVLQLGFNLSKGESA